MVPKLLKTNPFRRIKDSALYSLHTPDYTGMERLWREDGVDYLALPADAGYPLDKVGVETSLRKLIAAWPHRAPGHEKEPEAPVAFKYVVGVDTLYPEITRGLSVPKSWRTLASGIFTKSTTEAYWLKPWTLIIPPLAPVEITTVIIPGLVHADMQDPVLEHFCPNQAHKSVRQTTLHFLREQDAERFLELAIRPID